MVGARKRVLGTGEKFAVAIEFDRFETCVCTGDLAMFEGLKNVRLSITVRLSHI